MKTQIKLWLLILVCMSLLLLNCDRTQEDWEKAQNVNTVKAYEEFLQNHKDSEFTHEASKRIEKLSWESVKMKDTKPDYLQFLGKYNDGDFAEEAYQRIEMIDWKDAKRVNKIESYNTFIQENPNSIFGDSARKKIEGIEQSIWEKALKVNTVDSYEQYKAQFPNGRFTKKAMSNTQKILDNQYIGTITGLRRVQGMGLDGLDTEPGISILIDTYPQNMFLASEKDIIKWGMLVRDESSASYNVACRGWKVKLYAVQPKGEHFTGQKKVISAEILSTN
ncbi:MAG: hypothetical protein CV087_21050 [Candidatus Brocadia sp. WS118]|nr:MAG: hypothetical protein CV087_21050 [Candidatus Brocadia sp. WS118]